jgi:hypothetical protein
MKRYVRIWMVAILLVAMAAPTQQAHAAFPIWEIIRKAVVKVIKAVDLAIQRQQNKVIWLQNAQKKLENTMSKLKLDEITEWTEKQRKIYKDYFEELQKVKALIAYYKRIREITDKQYRLVNEYRRVWDIVQNDGNFTPKEIAYMGHVYSGILEESVKNIDQIGGIITAFKTSMTDGKRLEIVNAAAERVDRNYDDLRKFNSQNMMLSIQRSGSVHEAQVIKQLYGIE